MRISFAHLCDYAMVANGKLSLTGIFTRIGALSFPARHGPLFLAFELVFDAPEMGRQCRIEIQLRDADGGELAKVEGQFVPEGTPPPGEHATASQIIQFPPIQFPAPGDYEFAFFLNEDYESSVRFKVYKAETAGG